MSAQQSGLAYTVRRGRVRCAERSLAAVTERINLKLQLQKNEAMITRRLLRTNYPLPRTARGAQRVTCTTNRLSSW